MKQDPPAAEENGGFSKLDADFVRVLEDLIDTLITKGTLRLTDLPVQAQRKLNERKQRRALLSEHLDLLDNDDGHII